MSIVFVISAPSGAGKSTLVGRLFQQEQGLKFSVSFTSRAPRGQEVAGVNYHYVSRQEFETRVRNDEFLEWAEVHGQLYGTHRSELEAARAAGLDLVLDIDVQGARQLKRKVPEAVGIFVLPPSMRELELRLRSRSEDSQEAIERRLRQAGVEIQEYGSYDYLIVNREVEAAAAVLCGIVKAERARRARMDAVVQPILRTFGS